MRYSIFLVLAIFLFVTPTTKAQIIKDRAEERAKQRAEDKVNRRINNTIDDAVDDVVDEAFNKIESIFKKKKRKKRSSDSEPVEEESSSVYDRSSSAQSEPTEEEISKMMESMLGGGDTKTEDSYEFKTIISMHTFTEKSSGKKKDEMDFDWMFSSSGSSFGMASKHSKTDVLMIMDFGNNVMINLDKKNKRAMVFSMDIAGAANSKDDIDKHSTYKKTGRTKKILGYSCDEYAFEDDDNIGTVWITDQLKGFDFSKMPDNFKNEDSNAWAKLGKKGGVFLETTMQEKGKRSKTYHMNATKVNTSGKKISLKNYKVTSLGDMLNEN